jgi:dUTP pyrophosphatase
MKLFVKKVDGLTLPARANALDAGYDIVATSGPNVVADKEDVVSQPLEDIPILYRAITYIEYDTNLYVAPDSDAEFKHVTLQNGYGPFIEAEPMKVFIAWHLELFPRSSISKYNLVLANSIGTVDTGYRNQVKLRYKYIAQPKDFLVKRAGNGDWLYYVTVDQSKVYQQGDKIAQFKARPNVNIDLELVDELPAADARGLGGFGSSGK